MGDRMVEAKGESVFVVGYIWRVKGSADRLGLN